MVLPSEKENSVQIWQKGETVNLSIEAWDVGIGFLQLSPDASLLAKSSQDGKYIRLFKLENGDLTEIKRYYRGMSAARLWGIQISDKFLTVTSERDTIHIFEMPTEEVLSISQAEEEEAAAPDLSQSRCVLQERVYYSPMKLGFAHEDKLVTVMANGKIKTVEITDERKLENPSEIEMSFLE